MVKKKTTRKKSSYKRKSFFLSPSSQFRLPVPLLIIFSLGFFLWLCSYIMSQAKPAPKSVYASLHSTSNLVKTPQETPIPIASPTESLGYCLTVPILMYHHVQPLAEAKALHHEQLTVDNGVFESQLAYLNDRKYTAITLDSLVEALQNRTSLPTNSIVLTFDDGYRDSYIYAYPLLKKYNMIGNFMIPTGLIENTDYMNWNQVKEMAGDSHVSLYNHTWSHAALGQVSKEKIEYEITTSTQDFINKIGHMSTVFAYPYGSYSDEAIFALRAHGFTAAVTTDPGRLQCDSYLMKLKRDRVGNSPLSIYGL